MESHADEKLAAPPTDESSKNEATRSTAAQIYGDGEGVQIDGDAKAVQMDGNAEAVQIDGDAKAVQMDGNAEAVQIDDDAEAVQMDGNAEAVQFDGDAAAVHIVHLIRPEGEEPEAFDIRTLSSVIGSEEAAKKAVIYHYTHAASGFAARLTPTQVAQLSEKPEVLSVAPDRVLQLIR